MAIQQTTFTFPSFVSGNSLSSALTLPGVFLSATLVVPTMTGGFGADTQIFIQGSADGVSFYRLASPQVNTSTVASNDFVIASSTTQRLVPLPAGFAPLYMRLETTAPATAGVTSNAPFKIICISNQ